MGAAGGAMTNVLGFGFNLAGLAVEDNARQRENNYAMGALKQNEQIAGQAALSSLEKGEQDEMASRLKYGQLRGEQTTALGASGVSATSGSALDILANTDAMSDYDAKVIRTNAAREAWAYRMKQQDIRRQQGLLKQKANDGATNTLLKAGGMTLGTIGDMAASGVGGKGG